MPTASRSSDAPAQGTKPPAARRGAARRILCTRNVKFELSDHQDCGGNGLTATGFATVELGGSAGTTVRFK